MLAQSLLKIILIFTYGSVVDVICLLTVGETELGGITSTLPCQEVFSSPRSETWFVYRIRTTFWGFPVSDPPRLQMKYFKEVEEYDVDRCFSLGIPFVRVSDLHGCWRLMTFFPVSGRCLRSVKNEVDLCRTNHLDSRQLV